MAEVIELSIDFDGTEGSDGSTLRQIFEDNLRTEVAAALSIPKDAVIIHAVDVANGEIPLGFLAGDAAERVGAGDQTTVSTTLEVGGGPCADFDEAAMEVALAAELGVDAARVSVTKDCSGADASPIIVDDDRRRRLSESTDTRRPVPRPRRGERAADGGGGGCGGRHAREPRGRGAGARGRWHRRGAVHRRHHHRAGDGKSRRGRVAGEDDVELRRMARRGHARGPFVGHHLLDLGRGAFAFSRRAATSIFSITGAASAALLDVRRRRDPRLPIYGLAAHHARVSMYGPAFSAIGVGGFAGVCAGAFVCLCVIPCVICCVCRRRRRKRKQSEEDLWENMGRPAGVRHLGLT